MNRIVRVDFVAIFVLLTVLGVGAIGLFIWSVDKGFDITDEGFYLLGYMYPAEYDSSFTNYNLIVSKLLNPNDTSLITYRIAGLVIAIVASQALSAGIWSFVKSRFTVNVLPYWLLSSFFLLGSFMQYSIASRTISYNSINSFCLAIFSSAVLFYISSIHSRPLTWQHAYLFLGSLLIGLDLFVKSSSSLAGLAVGGLVIALCSEKRNIKPLYTAFLTCIAGFGAGLILYFIWVQPFAVWIANYKHEISILLETSYGSGLLVKYINNFYPIARTVIYPFMPVAIIVSFLLFNHLKKIFNISIFFYFIIAIGLISLVLYQAVRTNLYKNTHLNFNRSAAWFLGFIVIMLSLFLVDYFCKADKSIKKHVVVILMWFFIMPFIGAVGTYNNLFINVVVDINYWLAFLCLLYASATHETFQIRAIAALVFILPGLTIAEQYVYGLLYTPYLQAENMLQQKYPMKVGNGGGSTVIRLDKGTYKFVNTLRDKLHRSGFKAGNTIIAAYDMPGLVYLLDGVSPGNPWLFNALDVRNCDALAKTKRQLNGAYIITNEKTGPELTQCMISKNILLAEGYAKVTQLKNPYARSLYQWHANQDTIILYAPVRNMPAAKNLEKGISSR